MDKKVLIEKEESKKFPVNPFPDVKPQDFNKLNKKKVTEDFVSENFKLMGWNVFEPFTDTGIDRIITKKICPRGHTPVNISERNVCRTCGTPTIDIIRFVQIKTRALKKDMFGFTLKSKDIRIDPRHVYVFYCDTTRDFLILSVYDYLKFFDDVKSNPFASTSFRKGNQKLNTLRYDKKTNKWSWAGCSWESFRNVEGLKRLQNPEIDLNLRELTKEVRKLNNKLLIKFNAGKTYPRSIEKKVNNELNKKLKKYTKKKNIVKTRDFVLKYLKKAIKDKAIFESIMKYWETIKNLEISGELEEGD